MTAVLLASSASGQPEPNYFPDLSKPMEFRVGYTGGNCHSCTWIAAQGVITDDTPAEFAAFVESVGVLEGGAKSVHLNSPGGRLGAALKLGKLIRDGGWDTVVAETAGHDDRDLFLDSDNPVCASACVFAFVAGNNRAVSQNTSGEETGYQKLGKLGVHQFYSPQEDTTIFDSTERSKDQGRTAILLKYLFEMGISADLLAMAMATPPDRMYWLNETDIQRLELDTFTKEIQPRLVGYPNGVGIVEISRRTRRGQYRYEFFCDAQERPMLKLSIAGSGFELDGEVAPNSVFDPDNFFEELGVALPGNTALVSLSESVSPNEEKVLEAVYVSQTGSLADLTNQLRFQFGFGGSSYEDYLAADLGFTLSDPFDGFHLLSRVCLQ